LLKTLSTEDHPYSNSGVIIFSVWQKTVIAEKDKNNTIKTNLAILFIFGPPNISN